MKHVLTLFISLILLLASIGCNSTPNSVNENLSAEEIFQKAQDAVNTNHNYDAAIFYYNTFLERYPNMKAKVVEAKFEIANIYRKKKDFVEAKSRFAEIIEIYRNENSSDLPSWILILTKKLLETIPEESQ
jgi:outer membrane protein assembly factor BamD (BamD/ComL family)